MALDKDTELELVVCKYFNIEPLRLKFYPISLFNDMVTFMDSVIKERKIKDFQEKARKQLRSRFG